MGEKEDEEGEEGDEENRIEGEDEGEGEEGSQKASEASWSARRPGGPRARCRRRRPASGSLGGPRRR